MRIPVKSKRFRVGELGIEARCAKCLSWWPADAEFFYTQSDGSPHSWCIACYREWRQARRHTTPATTPQAGGNRHDLDSRTST